MIELQASLRGKLVDVGGLRDALQQAIMLEHATIPTYLYALYSLKPGTNTAIADLVSSVVIEEMSHMALAANLLNAIDGAPVIDDPAFVPDYPGPLPGSVASGLVVPLKRLSIDLVRDVFMVIEEPEDPLSFPTATALADTEPLTIGGFYRSIANRLTDLGDRVFSGDPAKQVKLEFGRIEVTRITNVKSAVAAIETIVEEGEGTKTSPLDDEHELAHYYRFAEIVNGRRLVPDPSSDFSYTGDPIPFDASGVAALVDNPKLASYPVGSQARRACLTFNYTYTNLLKSLHSTFNGEPDRMHDAIGLMESLKIQALDMAAAAPLPGGGVAGPSFEYQPLNPA